MAGLGTLAQLKLNHLDLRVARVGGELVSAKATVIVAAAKVARAYLPH